MSLVIVILNYRTAELTEQCLASLMPCLGEWRTGARVVVVDNASGDGSVERLRGYCRRWDGAVEVLEAERNLGFAGGNNLALEEILRGGDAPEFVLLLNSDTVFRAGVLGRCVEMVRVPEVGVLSCRLDNADGTQQLNARKLPTPARMTAHVLGLAHHYPRAFGWADLEDAGWDRHENREVEWVGGAFMLVRAAVMREVGMLDGSFFFYGEDAEFCHRVRRAGWKVWYLGAVGIVHLGGGSSDPARLARRAKDRLSWEARYLLQRRCYGWVAEMWLRGLDLLTYAARCVRLALTPSRRQDYLTHREILSVLLTRPRARASGRA